MCAKKKELKLTAKEAAKRGQYYNFAAELKDHAGKPTYFFSVGDKVSVGNLQNCEVDEVCENGLIYGIKHGKEQENYGYWTWIHVRPITETKDAVFHKETALSRMNFYNMTVESLMATKYNFGLKFDPDYQRGSVWDDKDREKLLDSVFCGREIGRFVLREAPYKETLENGHCLYEIVDGKQRLLTLCDYFENRFAYKGYFYNDLPGMDKWQFNNLTVSVATLSESTSKKEVLEVFLALNESGRPVDPSVMEHAKELLEAEAAKGFD